MPTKKVLCKVSEIPEDSSGCFEIEDKRIALFHRSGKLYALNNVCPHRGGPLAEGIVADGFVSCPFHGWKFRLENGQLSSNAAISVAVYAVSVEDGNVLIELP